MSGENIISLLAGWFRGKNAGEEKKPWRVGNPHDLAAVAAEHRLRFMKEIRQPLMLVSEVQRSGGTLLSRLFDGHPQVYAHPHELKIGRPSKYFWPALDLSARPDEWWENIRERHLIGLVGRGYKKDARADGVNALPFIFSVDIQKSLFVAVLSRVSKPTQRQILDAYATSFFNGWIDYQGLYRDPSTVKYWTGFVPRLAMSEEQCLAFFRDYPDGYLFSVIRDPLSWFASARPHKPEEHTLERGVELWLDSSRAAVRNLARHPDRVILLHFNDLVSDTEGIMRAVCLRTGLEFHPSLLSPTFNGMPLWANTSFHVGQPGVIVKASLERGAQLNDAEASFLKMHTEDCYREALSRTLKSAG